MATVNIALQNQTTSNTVYAYITGQALENNNAVFLLQSDGKSYYYPSSPSSTGSPLAKNCAIPLGPPGNTVTVTVPHLAGSRIWFSVDSTLTFLLNPGPAIVEPSVTNPTDPNINHYWDFCEFTFNSSHLFVNISYVDFVCLPISLTLTNTSGRTQHVAGMGPDGLSTVCSALTAQSNSGESSVLFFIVLNDVLDPNLLLGGTLDLPVQASLPHLKVLPVFQQPHPKIQSPARIVFNKSHT